KMFVGDQLLIDQIAAQGATVEFTANLKVTDQGLMNTPTVPGGVTYWQLPQVRGQFAGKYDNDDDVWSCDSWGDNMTVIKTGTNTHATQGIIGNSGLGTTVGYQNQQLCGRWFRLVSTEWGGMQSFDEFPNEFRPVMLWPTNEVSSDIPFTNNEIIDISILS